MNDSSPAENFSNEFIVADGFDGAAMALSHAIFGYACRRDVGEQRRRRGNEEGAGEEDEAGKRETRKCSEDQVRGRR